MIGPNGNKERLGGYSGMPPYYVTVLDGIKQRAGVGVNVVFAEGCRISEPDAAPNQNTRGVYKAPKPETDDKLLAEALQTANQPTSSFSRSAVTRSSPVSPSATSVLA